VGWLTGGFNPAQSAMGLKKFEQQPIGSTKDLKKAA
jgi:hypothetical protein